MKQYSIVTDYISGTVWDVINLGQLTVEAAIHEVTLSNLSNSIMQDVVILGIGIVIWHMDRAFGDK